MMRRTYHTEDIEAGLLALAVSAGNAAEANRVLKAQGRDIPVTTLRDWLKQHADRYEEVRRSASSQIEAKLLPDMIDTQAELHELARDGIRMLTKMLKNRYTCTSCDYSAARPATKDDRRCPQCHVGKLNYNHHDPDKLARMIKDTVSAFGTMQDKTRVRQMQPTEIVTVQNGDAELRALMSDPAFAALFVDGSAEDITPQLNGSPA